MDILISNLLSELIFYFGKWSTENPQIRVFAYFQLDHFPKLKINSESRFEIRMSILLFYKKKICDHLFQVLPQQTFPAYNIVHSICP